MERTCSANISRALLQRNIASYPRVVKDACYKIMIHLVVEYAAEPTVHTVYNESS